MKNKMGDLLKDFNIDSFREGNRFEAKLAKGGLPNSLWETYSSFANTDGGLILLGVKENKNHSFTIAGVENYEQLIKNIWDTLNNQNKVSVNLLLNKNVYAKEVDGKQVICIEVPRAERQFRPVYIGKNIFDGTFHRNGEGDYRCTKEEISEMFRDANVVSSDAKILTEMDETVFCKDSIKSYRNRFNVLHMNHVWESLDDIDFLRKIGAVGFSAETGKQHPTAAGLLMFGYEYEIVHEFPLYFLDYQELFDETTRWSDRFVSSSGEWSGNVYDFFFKALNKLTEDVKRPFKLEGIFRVDDTPVHKAIREVLLNTLANADYYGRRGLVIRKYVDKFVFENPGSFRVPLQDAINGGNSDPRNATILKMFSMLEIGERAGSGIPGIVSVWEKTFNAKPIYDLKFNPSRVITTLDISGYVSPARVPSDKNPFQAINVAQKEVSSDKMSGKTTKTEDFQAKKEIPSDKINRKQDDVEKILLEVFADGLEHSVSELAKMVGLSDPRTRAIVSDLVSKGKLKACGANRNRTYKLL